MRIDRALLGTLGVAGAVALAASLVCCAKGGSVTPGSVDPHAHPSEATPPKATRRLVPPEAYLRTYLMWFGGLGPRGVFLRARGDDLFDSWPDYLAALGLPDYHFDVARGTQTSTIMLAALARLGEALCIRSVEHDLHERTPLAERVIFAFEPHSSPTQAQFADGFDVLHRTFLGYPAELATPERGARFYALYREVAENHAQGKLSKDELAWAAVCVALVQHPEAELY